MAAVAVISAGALCAGLVVSAGPAYADVTSSYYSIGSPSGAVSTVVATPGSVTANASSNFEVSFTAGAALSGSSDSFVTVAPSEDLGSAPSDIDIVGGPCIQGGTVGAGGAGASTSAGLTIELLSTCSISVGNTVQVYFTAQAPPSTGSFYFTVTTSSNSTLATSNTITIGNSASTLTAALYNYGANTSYTISNMPVANVTASGSTLFLTAIITSGTEALSFYNGVSGYSVTYTPSGGTAQVDPVDAATVIGDSVTLTLADTLSNGDTLNITAIGTNPPATSSTESNEITVQPGNGTTETSSVITFGNSVTNITVSPGSTVAGASTTYTVTFRASTAANVGGEITLSETAGPTNFTAVTGVEVSDTPQGWHFVATGSALSNGTAIIILSNAIAAGDFVTVTLAGVINPAAVTISDFKVSTNGDGVPAVAPPYTLGANASPGVAVSVSPSTTSALATYAISNLRASGTIAGGTTITIQAPSGTVFPNSPGFYNIEDSTTPSGSAAIGSVVSGGGTDDVVVLVPNTINSGDLLLLTIEDVINPSIASTTYSLTIVGNVTGLAPVATTTTTTVPPTTTTTRPKPVVASLTKSAAVSKKAVQLKLGCSAAACSGVITLADVRTEIGHSKYKLAAGKTGKILVGLFAVAATLMAGAKHHTITVTETVTVAGGKTVAPKLTIVP